MDYIVIAILVLLVVMGVIYYRSRPASPVSPASPASPASPLAPPVNHITRHHREDSLYTATLEFVNGTWKSTDTITTTSLILDQARQLDSVLYFKFKPQSSLKAKNYDILVYAEGADPVHIVKTEPNVAGVIDISVDKAKVDTILTIEIVPGLTKTRLMYEASNTFSLHGPNEGKNSWHNLVHVKAINYNDFNLYYLDTVKETYNGQLYQGKSSINITTSNSATIMWFKSKPVAINTVDISTGHRTTVPIESSSLQSGKYLVSPDAYVKSDIHCPWEYRWPNSYCSGKPNYMEWMCSHHVSYLKKWNEGKCAIGINSGEVYKCYSGINGYLYTIQPIYLPNSAQYLEFQLE